MTKREDQMRERIHSVEEQLVKAAIMITEAREERDEFRAALDRGPAASVEAQAEINHWRERAEAAEKAQAYAEDALLRCNKYAREQADRAEATEKEVKRWKDAAKNLASSAETDRDAAIFDKAVAGGKVKLAEARAEAAEKRVKELEEARGLWPHWGDRPDGFDGPGGAE